MLQHELPEVLAMISSYRLTNKYKIDAIDLETKALAKRQFNNPKDLVDSENAGIQKSYQVDEHIHNTSEELYELLQKVNEENRVWINLNIRYTNLAVAKGIDIEEIDFNSIKPIPRQIELLNDILYDLEQCEEFEYCAVLKRIIDEITERVMTA